MICLICGQEMDWENDPEEERGGYWICWICEGANIGELPVEPSD